MTRGALRRSSRPRGPSKDAFADDFVGDQWHNMRCDPKKSQKLKDGNDNKTGNHLEVDTQLNPELEAIESQEGAATMAKAAAAIVNTIGGENDGDATTLTHYEEWERRNAEIDACLATAEKRLMDFEIKHKLRPPPRSDLSNVVEDLPNHPLSAALEFKHNADGISYLHTAAAQEKDNSGFDPKNYTISDPNVLVTDSAHLPTRNMGVLRTLAAGSGLGTHGLTAQGSEEIKVGPRDSGKHLGLELLSATPHACLGAEAPSHSMDHVTCSASGAHVSVDGLVNEDAATHSNLHGDPLTSRELFLGSPLLFQPQSPTMAHLITQSTHSGQATTNFSEVVEKSLASSLVNSATTDQIHNGLVANAPISNTWAGLFKSTSQEYPISSRQDTKHVFHSQASDAEAHISSFDLEFVDHKEKAADLVLRIPKELTEAGKGEWNTTLVGRFLGKKLPFSLVTKVTDQFWGTEGLIDTLATDSGCFFFIFSSAATRDAVLEGGPWFVAGQPLLLRPWTPHFSFQKEDVRTIPIWINFYGIPLEFWNPKGISFISSFIGRPIRVDRVTATRRRITYARVCIEVGVDFDFFTEFHIETEDEVTGKPIRTPIKLEYQWTPQRCIQCAQFGHDCSKAVKPTPRSFPVSQSHKKVGKEVGVWQVVSHKDKGKKTVESGRPNDIAPLVRGNKFAALAQAMVNPSSDILHTESKAPLLVRMDHSEANISHHPADDIDDVREGLTCSTNMDEVNNSDNGYASDDVCGSLNMGSSSSNRQRKREAKMKFSGSRPKGRHRT